MENQATFARRAHKRAPGCLQFKAKEARSQKAKRRSEGGHQLSKMVKSRSGQLETKMLTTWVWVKIKPPGKPQVFHVSTCQGSIWGTYFGPSHIYSQPDLFTRPHRRSFRQNKQAHRLRTVCKKEPGVVVDSPARPIERAATPIYGSGCPRLTFNYTWVCILTLLCGKDPMLCTQSTNVKRSI